LYTRYHMYFLPLSVIVSLMTHHHSLPSFFFFNPPATTDIYTLSLHDALPICLHLAVYHQRRVALSQQCNSLRHLLGGRKMAKAVDRKSTRLNSSHVKISYAVFCLKKKKKKPPTCPSTP